MRNYSILPNSYVSKLKNLALLAQIYRLVGADTISVKLTHNRDSVYLSADHKVRIVWYLRGVRETLTPTIWENSVVAYGQYIRGWGPYYTIQPRVPKSDALTRLNKYIIKRSYGLKPADLKEIGMDLTEPGLIAEGGTRVVL